MPVFAFGFGSFGDIYTVVELAVRVAIILRQSGDSNECAETEKELKALSRDLELADRTLQQTAGSPLAPFAAARIRDEVVQCHKLMARFFMKITAPPSFVQRICRAASQEKELAKFRMQINERRSALGLVMDVINSGALMAVRDRIDDVGGQVRHGIQDVHNGVSSVAQQLDEVGGQVRHGHNLIQDGFSSLGEQFTTYHAQIMAVINHVPHGVSDASFVVISPTGISIPVSLTFCTSYSVLDGLLKTYLGGRKEAGGRYVERGEYYIASPEGDIIHPPDFIATLKAGLRLQMSIRMRVVLLSDRCPQCNGRRVETSPLAGWTSCQNPTCGSIYRNPPLENAWPANAASRARSPVPSNIDEGSDRG